MAMTAPGSPPELTGSKSSKSSSYRSSSQLDHDGILHNISHFEDIGLDDHDLAEPYLTGPYSLQLERLATIKRPPLRMPSTDPGSTPASVGCVRELTDLRKRAGPGGKGPLHPSPTEHGQLRLPRTSSGRGLVSPSAPSLVSASVPRQQSRSPSPSTRPQSASMPQSTPLALPRLRQQPSPVLRPHPRRSSWQPGRKTVKELEEAYDSDEDVPEDAIIWNVPISPRLPHERTNSIRSASASAHSSASTSPERRSPLSKSVRAADIKSPLPFKRPVTRLRRTHTGSLPTSPTKPALPRGASTGSFPLEQHRRLSDCRTNSWNAALSDLSDEAKTLTEALEHYADAVGRHDEENIQHRRNIPLSSAVAKPSMKETLVELPPLRTGNVMIDPLPISREKEAVLTRTRPSWLPPKSKREERKHLKEYQKMMERSLEAERKRHAREQQQLLERDSTAESILRIWDHHVLPNWEDVIREPRTRELWWRGIAPRSRGVVWERAIGNELALSGKSYAAALGRAKDLDEDLRRHPQVGTLDEDKERKRKWFTAIRRDVATTFPDLKIFQAGGPLNEGLVDVLQAYSMYRSDVGYVYGTHTMTALLLLNLPPASAFTTLANLLNRPLPLAFLTGDPAAMERVYSLTVSLLSHKYPRLHHHLTAELGLPAALFLEPMFRTLFTAGLSMDIVSRVWDCWVFEGDTFLVRTAVAVLARLEQVLYGRAEEVLGVLGWHAQDAWDVGREDDFLRFVRAVGKEGNGRKVSR
ncbi:MAG: hypothetical protein M1817_001771 [Caeruleum heppii]|nr:MAG: hypothetical protein M1817_001771 [Caeruleum heppii]